MVTTDPKAKVDVSPIVVTEIMVDGRRLVAEEPLRFEVRVEDSDEGSWVSITGPFEIMLGAPTRAEVGVLLQDEFAFLWHVYAEAEPLTLSPGAQRLREELRGRLIPADHAS